MLDADKGILAVSAVAGLIVEVVGVPPLCSASSSAEAVPLLPKLIAEGDSTLATSLFDRSKDNLPSACTMPRLTIGGRMPRTCLVLIGRKVGEVALGFRVSAKMFQGWYGREVSRVKAVERVAIDVMDMVPMWDGDAVRKDPHHRVEIQAPISEIAAEVRYFALWITVEIDAHPRNNLRRTVLCFSHKHIMPYFSSSSRKNSPLTYTGWLAVPRMVRPSCSVSFQISASALVCPASAADIQPSRVNTSSPTITLSIGTGPRRVVMAVPATKQGSHA